MHKRTKFISEDAEWPPNQAKLVVSVALIHYKGKRTQQELFQMATIYKEGAPAIDNLISSYEGPSAKKSRLDYSKVTKSIIDIFATDPTDLTETGTNEPKRILIEGAPGIGKTVLAKEIAYQWATNEILTEIKIVFLLYLRDPQLQSIKTTKQLVEYMSMGCLDDEQIATFSKYLVNTHGQQLCILMDGFDEYPSDLQRNSYILKIIKGIVLHECVVVITSRPTATVSLHNQVDRRIDILGLPREEREKYILKIFRKSPDKKDMLDKYLKQQPVINGLCFVPLHLAILLYLFQQGSLPETLTEMNESFILHTIYRHLEKYGPTPSGTVEKLSKLPKKVLDDVHGLSVLAFNGLQENKLVFTSDEIKQECPHFKETKGAINGYGLLQAVEHLPHEGSAAGKATSLNFLHYTMQEFLGALHVSNLPSEQQSSLMNKTFWNGHYNFMWMMFVGIVGIKSDIFVNFTSEGKVYKGKSEIRFTQKIKKDKRKLLHVFQCYLEAKENKKIPKVISSLFKDGKVIFSHVYLLPHHISSLMTYMTNSSMQCNTLKLNRCNITDIGMSVLKQLISDNASAMEYVDLSDNDSSPWGVYCAIIRHCSVSNLTLCGDYGIEDYVNEIKECLQMNTKLISLTLYNIINNGAIQIAEVIHMNTTLRKFNFLYGRICDGEAEAIGNGLKYNVSLQELNISHNNIADRGIKIIAEAIQMNSTLQNINISKNHISTEGILYFMEAVKNNCTLQVVNITHNNVTRSGFTRIKQCIKNLQHPIQIITSWNEIVSSSGELSVISKICTFKESETISEDVWSFEDYDHDHIVTCLSECLKEDDMLLELNMFKNSISGNKNEIYEALKVNKTLQKLDASFTEMHQDLIWDLLKINESLIELNISNNKITGNGAKEIATAIGANETLKKLNLSCNELHDEGVAFISDGLKINVSLQELNMSKNKITNEGTKYLAEAIQVNTTLEKLDLSNNAISNDGAAAISDSLQFNISLQKLSMSRNEIISGRAKTITKAIQVNDTLKQLDLSTNKVNDEGANFICDILKNNASLQELNISTNDITNRGIKMIAKAIQINSTLQNINISRNRISIEGLQYFIAAVENICTVQVVNMTHNYVTRSGFTDIKQYIENFQRPIQVIASWNEIKEGGELVTKIPTFYTSDNIEEAVRSFDAYNECLSECLEEDSIVRKIKLNNHGIYNYITSEGAIKIAGAIKVNKTLQELDIRQNNISDNGAAAISDALKSNSSLKILNISSNKITDEAAFKIGEAIKMNETLLQLDLSHNSISDDGAAAISDALKSNNSLQMLDMSFNNITNEAANKIAEAIKVNTTLHTLYLYQHNINDALSFNMSVLTAMHHNDTLMKLLLPLVCINDDKRSVSSEVGKINKERTRRKIKKLLIL